MVSFPGYAGMPRPLTPAPRDGQAVPGSCLPYFCLASASSIISRMWSGDSGWSRDRHLLAGPYKLFLMHGQHAE